MRSFWVGISWGFGHTATLFILGVVIIALRLSVPDRLALFLEFGVGIMLVGLGVQVIYNFRKRKVHQHEHGHVESEHQHYHSHVQNPGNVREHHQLFGVGKPFLRKKSFFIGMFQGVAGTAAVTLLVLASIDSPVTGAVYLLLFGVGSVVSMGAMTILIGLPFAFSSNRLPNLSRFIQFSVGALSILFGFGLMYHIGFVEGLF
tara:strand:+ start:2821 stop:3429 length:609 start_codon:yes stop_codon:yes gene_type:complete